MARLAKTAWVGLLALALFGIHTAKAQTVSSSVDGSIDGVNSSDPAGPSSSPVASFLTFPDGATIDFGGSAMGAASQRPNGVGAVTADGIFADGSDVNRIVSSTNWMDTATNGNPAPSPYEFDYFITPAQLRIADFAGLEDTDPQRPQISYSIVIRANGGIVFQSSATLVGGDVSHALFETGTSLNPTFVNNGSDFGYNFGPRSDTIDLGMVGPGESITVEYEMTVTVDTPGFEVGGRASIGDPFDLEGSPGFVGTFLSDGVVSNGERSWGELKSSFE